MMWGNGFGGWGMALMGVGTLLFWGLLISAVVLLVRYANRGTTAAAPNEGSPTPQRILAERFARGEIDDEEYIRRLHLLDAATPTRPAGG